MSSRETLSYLNLQLMRGTPFRSLDLLDQKVAVLNRTTIHLAEIIAIYHDMFLKPNSRRIHD